MKRVLIAAVSVALLSACGGEAPSNSETLKPAVKPQSMLQKEADPMQDKGIGPIKEVTFDEAINEELAATGQALYEEKCTACHKPTERFIGPPQSGVLKRRSPEWVMNMILNPDQMLKENAIAKKLLKEYNNVPMTYQDVSEEQARAILEYFRKI